LCAVEPQLRQAAGPLDAMRQLLCVTEVAFKRKEELFEYKLYTIKMMMKKIFTVTLLLISALSGYGQLSWNVKAGMNMSKVTDFTDAAMKPGHQFGVGIDYYFSEHWGILPSLMIISKGYKSQGPILAGYQPNPDYPSELDDIVAKYQSYENSTNRIYIEMPLMLAYRFNLSNTLKLVFNGGGYISYGIGGKDKLTMILKDGSTEKTTPRAFSETTYKLDFGLGAGTAFEIKNRYTIGLFGEWGLQNTYQTIYTKTKVSEKNQTYGLNIGYKF
jgi:hypothetical protein